MIKVYSDNLLTLVMKIIFYQFLKLNYIYIDIMY